MKSHFAPKPLNPSLRNQTYSWLEFPLESFKHIVRYGTPNYDDQLALIKARIKEIIENLTIDMLRNAFNGGVETYRSCTGWAFISGAMLAPMTLGISLIPHAAHKAIRYEASSFRLPNEQEYERFSPHYLLKFFLGQEAGNDEDSLKYWVLRALCNIEVQRQQGKEDEVTRAATQFIHQVKNEVSQYMQNHPVISTRVPFEEELANTIKEIKEKVSNAADENIKSESCKSFVLSLSQADAQRPKLHQDYHLDYPQNDLSMRINDILHFLKKEQLVNSFNRAIKCYTGSLKMIERSPDLFGGKSPQPKFYRYLHQKNKDDLTLTKPQDLLSIFLSVDNRFDSKSINYLFLEALTSIHVAHRSLQADQHGNMRMLHSDDETEKNCQAFFELFNRCLALKRSSAASTLDEKLNEKLEDTSDRLFNI